MLSDERLRQLASEISAAPNASPLEAQDMARELLSLRWSRITPGNLPKVGDEELIIHMWLKENEKESGEYRYSIVYLPKAENAEKPS